MKEIYELKKQGLTYKEICGKLKKKISVSALCIALTRYCEKEGLEMPKSKQTGRPVKIYELK